MDLLMLIRAGIFLVAGLVMIIFRVRLNNWKNNLFVRFHIKRKNEIKSYIYIGIVFMVVSIILAVYSVLN